MAGLKFFRLICEWKRFRKQWPAGELRFKRGRLEKIKEATESLEAEAKTKAWVSIF